MRPRANAKKAQRKAKAAPKAAPAPMVEVEAEATPQPKAKATPKAEPKAKARPEAKPAPTGEEMPKQMPLQDLSALLCSWCGTWQPYNKCRLQKKGDHPKYKCNRCHSVYAKLYTAFGQWPTDAFENMPHAEQQQFYRSCATQDRRACKATADKIFEQYARHEKVYAENGQFLPLGVWETAGYNVDAIESESLECNKQINPILGLCYRVPILETGVQGARGRAQTARNTVSGKDRRAQKALEAAAAAIAEEAGEETEEEQEAGDRGKKRSMPSSSSSSSSSSSGHKKKKKKKSKKEKRGKKEKDAHMSCNDDKRWSARPMFTASPNTIMSCNDDERWPATGESPLRRKIRSCEAIMVSGGPLGASPQHREIRTCHATMMRWPATCYIAASIC